MNLTWLGLGCLAGVILWLASDAFVLLVLGVLMGTALGIGFADRGDGDGSSGRGGSGRPGGPGGRRPGV